MTQELIWGKSGSPHIDGSDIGTINLALRGIGNYVLDYKDNLKASVASANKITIGTGVMSFEGRDIIISAAENVTIESGSQGMKRNDIICEHYHRDTSSGVETTNLVAIKGTPASSNPKDPTIPSGTILGGATDAYMPLYRVPLDGITVGTPVQLFEILTPLKTVGDSVTPTGWVQLSPSVTYRKCAGIVIVMTDHLNITQKQTKIQIGQLPAGFRPGKRPQAKEDDSYAAVGALTSRSDGMCGVIGVNAEGVVYVSANEVNSHFAGEVVFPATT